jgi:cytochrome c oxidase assembly protein subunit 15
MIVNRLAWIALVSVIILVVAGATVRVTGSGLGCPDWPTCWGCWIPPTSADQIDVDKLDLDKFKRHATRKGIDPDTITRDSILDEFNPVQTWIEYCNRLATLPLGLATLLLAICSFFVKRRKWTVVCLSWFCLIDVLANAIMGAIVVRSGLQPGIITLHMALAFLLIAVLVTVIWLSRTPEDSPTVSFGLRRKLLAVSLVFFACLFGEGLLGSQLREQTDELTLVAEGEEALGRVEWTQVLASTLIFKIHRTFSWSLLLTSGLMLFWVQRSGRFSSPEPKLIFGLVVLMMLMGIVLGHVAIFQVVQVLHVGATSVLLAVTWHWITRLWATQAEPATNGA